MSEITRAVDCPLCRHGLPCPENDKFLRGRVAVLGSENAALVRALEQIRDTVNDPREIAIRALGGRAPQSRPLLLDLGEGSSPRPSAGSVDRAIQYGKEKK